MAEIIPFDGDRRCIVQMLEEALEEAKTGQYSSVAIVFVRPQGSVGNYIYCSTDTGVIMGTAILAASHDFIQKNLWDEPAPTHDAKEPA